MVSRESQDAWNWSLCYARAFSLPQSMSEIRTGCLICDPVNAFSIQAASAREPEEEIKQNKQNKEWQLRIMWLWDFSIGPVVKTPHFQCRGLGFYLWFGNWNPKRDILRNMPCPGADQKKLKSCLQWLVLWSILGKSSSLSGFHFSHL